MSLVRKLSKIAYETWTEPVKACEPSFEKLPETFRMLMDDMIRAVLCGLAAEEPTAAMREAATCCLCVQGAEVDLSEYCRDYILAAMKA